MPFARDQFRDVFGELRLCWADSDHPVAFPFECRFVAADDIPLRPRRTGDRARTSPSTSTGRCRTSRSSTCEDVFAPVDGRPHWGKMHRLERADCAHRYPAVRRLRRAAGRARPDRGLRQRLPRPGPRRPDRSRDDEPVCVPGAGHGAPRAAVRRGRSRRPGGQRPDHGASGRQHADPVGQQVRSRAAPIQRHVLAMDGYRGVLAFTLPEALWLARRGRGRPRRVPDRGPRGAAYPRARRASSPGA